MKNVPAIFAVSTLGLFALLTACSDADVASRNLSQSADNFEIPRRVVLYNGITDQFIQEVQGLCSMGNNDVYPEVTITCKRGPGQFVKHMWTVSDNVTVFVEQLQNVDVSTDFYQVNFKPTAILPDFRLR